MADSYDYKKAYGEFLNTIKDRKPLQCKIEKNRWRGDGGRELQRNFDNIGADSIVFDAGLYKGGWSEVIAKRYNPYIYGFEPIKQYYEFAVEALGENPKAKVFNFGLGGFTRKTLISVDGKSSSFVQTGRGKHNPPENEVVQMVSIKEFMSEQGIGFVDLISINIEGTEYEMLPYMASEKLMSKFGTILIQFHDLEKIGSFAEQSAMREILALTHNMVYSYQAFWDLWRLK